MRGKIYSLIILNHALALGGLLYFWDPRYLILSLIGVLLFGKLGGEAMYHRYIAHRSFELSKPWEIVLLYFGCLNCFGSPLGWAALHRVHHQHSDTDKDPHGSLVWWRVWMTHWRDSKIPQDTVRDLVKIKHIHWFHRNYFTIVIVTWVLLATGGLQIPIFLISLPAVITFHSAGLVNTICHRMGYRNFLINDKSYNNLFVNFLTLGSGLHNNHHAQPRAWNNRLHWYEVDLVGWFISKVKNP